MSLTTAGRPSRNCRRSRRRCRSKSRARSSRATNRPTFRSTARSILIAVANMAASTASRDRRMPSWACRRGSISNRNCSPSPMRQSCSTGSCRRMAIRPARSRSEQIPIRISRWKSSGASCARSSKSWRRAAIRSASSPNRRWSPATSTFWAAWPSADWPRWRCRSRRSTVNWRAPWSRARQRRRNGSKR